METRNKKTTILRFARKCLASMGFTPNQQLLNGRVLGGFLLPFSNVFLNTVFLLHDTNNFWEYINSIFVSLVAGVGFFAFVIFIFQVWKIFKIFDFGQKIYDNSK